MIQEAEKRASDLIFAIASEPDDWEFPEPKAVFSKATAIRAMLAFRTEALEEARVLQSRINDAAAFLVARLDELDWSVSMDDFANLHSAHIDPSHARLKSHLEQLRALATQDKPA